jgi:hypothetical protein
MPYEKESKKNINYPIEMVYESAKFCIGHMGGTILKDEQEDGILHAQMDKKLFGDYLGDRSKLEIKFTETANNETEVYIYAYPLNAVGQKLMFGARKDVVERMMAAFYEEIDKRLQEQK